MLTARNILVGKRKWAVALLALFIAAQCVFAVSKITSIGGDEKTKSGTYSNLRSTMHFSLKDSYTVRRNSKLFQTRNESMNHQSMVTYKKGNITYILPYKSKSAIKLPGFIRTSPMPTPSR